MPRIRRRFLLDPAEVGVYHCMSRCVRRAFLCGQDPLTGKNFEHRRQWIQDRMQFLAGQFGVDVLGFAVLEIGGGATQNSDVVWEAWVKRRLRRGSDLTGLGGFGMICVHLDSYCSTITI